MSVVTDYDQSSKSQLKAIYLCDHCGLEVSESLVCNEDDKQFCCGGCQVAFETIKACGLDDYYSLRDQVAKKVSPAKSVGAKYLAYDSETFLNKYSQHLNKGVLSIELQLEGVHCVACLWLIERLPTILKGVMESRLSMQNATVKIIWNSDQILLSQIATTLDQLGYPPHPAKASDARKKRQLADREQLIEMGVAGALAGNCMLIAVALYAGMFEGIEPHFKTMFHWLSMLLGMTSLVWPGRRFFLSAIRALQARTVNLDVPISMALATGGLAGLVNLIFGRGDIYFDSLSVLVFLLLAGRCLQVRQQRWAEDAVSMSLSMLPATCRLIHKGEVKEVAVEALECGNIIEIRSGEIFPADGIITEGKSTVDNSLLTGESVPVPLDEGNFVYSGSQNIGATLRIRVQSIGQDTRIGKLLQLVEEGASNKPPIVSFTDQIAGYFVLVVSLLATLNLIYWIAYSDIASAIDNTVALLIVACPCALGLATPLTIALSIGKASHNGVLIKDSSVVEQLGNRFSKTSRRMVFDKTGTLTHGKFEVVAWHGDTSIQPQVKAIESESNHPIAKGILEFLSDCSSCNSAFDCQEDHRNGGIKAQTTQGKILIGSPKFIRSEGIEIPRNSQEIIIEGESQGCTTVVVAREELVVSVIWLSDEVLPDASQALVALRDRNWQCEVLSGDAMGPVKRVAEQLTISSDQIFWETLPEEKLDHIKKIRSTNEESTVVMIGDGVNDAASLAAASVGIAVHGGAEASLAAADVFIRNEGTLPILGLVRHCEHTMRIIFCNLGVSIAYNLLAVSLAAMGLVNPLVAAILMPISSVTVLGIAIGSLAITDHFQFKKQLESP